jgi:uncharacterized membrane protein
MRNVVKFLSITCLTVALFESRGYGETYPQMKELIDKSCARCHNADGLADFLPFESFADIKPVIKKMAAALQTGKMPKDNATFNATADGQRLLTWLTSGEDLFPPTQQADTYATMKTIVDDNCKKCHNADGLADFLPFETFTDVKTNVNKMTAALQTGKMPKDNLTFNTTVDGKRLLTWLTSGSDLHSAPPTPPTPPPQQADTYATMKTIVDDNCKKCHNADGLADFLPFETFTDVKTNVNKMTAALQTGKMPKDNTTFNTTVDGKRLLTWLMSGSDLHPTVPTPPPVLPPHPIKKDPRDLTYEDMKPIIRRNCVGCHNPNGRMSRFPFETFDQVANKASAMYKQITRRKMPDGDPEFRFTADGRALLGWLEFGRDLNGG